jgi:hypothetical protein
MLVRSVSLGRQFVIGSHVFDKVRVALARPVLGSHIFMESVSPFRAPSS